MNKEQQEFLNLGVSLRPVTEGYYRSLLDSSNILNQDYPIYETVHSNSDLYFNFGASPCLILFVVGQNEIKSGHFNVLDISGFSDVKSRKDYKVYKQMLQDIKQKLIADGNIKVILFGQHLTSIQRKIEGFEIKSWSKKRRKVLEDFNEIGLKAGNLSDMRGEMLGATSTVYVSREEVIYYSVKNF